MDCIPVSCDASCIAFKHSGGISNCDPCQDLGGEISACDISGGLDNLLHSIGPKLSRVGHEDYRCFYIQNSNDTAVLRNTVIYMDGVTKQSGAIIALGVKLQNEKQQIIVNGTAPPNQGEYFTLQVPNYSPAFKVFYDANITKWIGNFQTAIRAVEGLPEVIVTGEVVGTFPNVTFTINFGGHDSRNEGRKGTQDRSRWMQAAHRQIDLIVVTTNTLLNCTVASMPLQEGSPVMTTAEVIPNEITAPSGITFNYYYRGNPIRIGDLRPQEYLPIWVKRTLPIVNPSYGNLARNGQMAKILDGFRITVDATAP